jgi:hypothetical protein
MMDGGSRSFFSEFPIYNQVGESAVFLYDKGRQPRAAAALTRMLEPDILDSLKEHQYGDKDLYWLSFALAGLEPGMNSMDVVPLGQWVYDPVDPEELCTLSWAFAQLVPQEGGELRGGHEVFYLNGDGVETLMKGGFREPGDMRLAIGNPLRYGDMRQEVHRVVNFRNSPSKIGHCWYNGFTHLSERTLDLIRTYERAYKRNDPALLEGRGG